MQSNFFRINLPYGIERNDAGEWTAFNRAYMPLGYNTKDSMLPIEASIYTSYAGLTEKVLLSVAERDGDSVRRNEQGQIVRIFLYNDTTNPMNQRKKDNPYWEEYWEKLEILSKLQVK